MERVGFDLPLFPSQSTRALPDLRAKEGEGELTLDIFGHQLCGPGNTSEAIYCLKWSSECLERGSFLSNKSLAIDCCFVICWWFVIPPLLFSYDPWKDDNDDVILPYTRQTPCWIVWQFDGWSEIPSEREEEKSVVLVIWWCCDTWGVFINTNG